LDIGTAVRQVREDVKITSDWIRELRAPVSSKADAPSGFRHLDEYMGYLYVRYLGGIRRSLESWSRIPEIKNTSFLKNELSKFEKNLGCAAIRGGGLSKKEWPYPPR
jgi:hypothetical protein